VPGPLSVRGPLAGIWGEGLCVPRRSSLV
jgi:hypothetical protein